MNRRVFIALAVATMAFSTSTASAGDFILNTQYVRIKNIGAPAVQVAAVNGVPPRSPAYRSLSQNGVTQFILKKGAGTLQVRNPLDAEDIAFLPYNFPRSTYVYLQVNTVGDRVKVTFAPPGTQF